MLAARGHSVGLLCWGPRNRLLDEIAGPASMYGGNRSDGHAAFRYPT
jgi:hypothetical protein